MLPAHLALTIAVVASAAALSALLIYVLRPVLIRHLLANPNERSSHVRATPQGAGVGVMLALFLVAAAGWLLWGARGGGMAPLWPVLIAAAGLTVLGLADDARALPVSWRFIGQTLAVLVMVASLPADLRLFPDLLPLLVERALLVLGTVWFVNAVNFLDGLDWITAAQVVPMTLGIAVLHALGAVPASIGFLALALLGATLGFAPFNKHPAKVFLGDAGSLPIGLLLAFMLIYVAGTDLAAALLLALYTLADSIITLFRRIYNRERIFSAHRSHFYQRAVIAGMTAPQVTARVFLLGLLLAGLAIAAVIARSTFADVALLAVGAAATGFVLYSLARGGK
ncbi:glycosyl transferase [Methyloceanibacter sp.]|uniref:glycosyl transferase n=1 Tax=Methyloceanibacter sp. TaxID=1965321 RepID=UPI00351B5A27